MLESPVPVDFRKPPYGEKMRINARQRVIFSSPLDGLLVKRLQCGGIAKVLALASNGTGLQHAAPESLALPKLFVPVVAGSSYALVQSMLSS